MGTDTTRSALTACPRCGQRARVPVAARGRVRCPQCRTDLPWLVDADDADFDAAVRDSRVPVLVDVWAAWCGPCRAVAPLVEQVARERAGRLKVVKVDADRAQGVTARLGVSGIPTLLVFRDGREVARSVGARPAAEVRRWLDEQTGAGPASA